MALTGASVLRAKPDLRLVGSVAVENRSGALEGVQSSDSMRTNRVEEVSRKLLNVTGRSDCYLVDPASGHMLVSKIKPCMSKHSW